MCLLLILSHRHEIERLRIPARWQGHCIHVPTRTAVLPPFCLLTLPLFCVFTNTQQGCSALCLSTRTHLWRQAQIHVNCARPSNGRQSMWGYVNPLSVERVHMQQSALTTHGSRRWTNAGLGQLFNAETIQLEVVPTIKGSIVTPVISVCSLTNASFRMVIVFVIKTGTQLKCLTGRNVIPFHFTCKHL